MTGAGRRPAKAPADAAKARAAHAVVKPPAWLARPDARAVWKRIAPELQRFNLMTEAFRDALGRYCLHLADWVKLSKQIDAEGSTVMVETTHSTAEQRRYMPRINPAIRVRDAAERSLLDLEDRFGLSPRARYQMIAHQAANPRGLGDLFGHGTSSPAASPDPDAVPAGPVTSQPASSPIGMLRVLN